jgi:hypothetical protein
MSPADSHSIRPASEASTATRPSDPEVSVRLAENFPVLGEPAVLAEVDGEPVAALGLSSGKVVAEPAHATSGVVALLHLRRLEARLIMSVFGA